MKEVTSWEPFSLWKTDCDVDRNDHKSTGLVGRAPPPQVVRMGKYLINSKMSKI